MLSLPIGCQRHTRIDGEDGRTSGAKPEYETVVLMGPDCGIYDWPPSPRPTTAAMNWHRTMSSAAPSPAHGAGRARPPSRGDAAASTIASARTCWNSWP